MARTLESILKDYEGIYFKESNNPRITPADYVRERMPIYLRTTDNDEFFAFVDKIFSYERKMEFWIWVLETQFSVLTARGKFLDNLGRWLGLSRPPLPVKRTNKPVVIYPPKLENTDMTQEELNEFNMLHGISDYNGEGVKNTFYPSRDFIGETLVNDDEYRLYITSLLRLKMGISFDTIIDVLTKILVKPFFVMKHNADILSIIASYYEDSIRLIIVREITQKLRTTGFNIEVLQATNAEPAEVATKYGKGCFDLVNPYLDESNKAMS